MTLLELNDEAKKDVAWHLVVDLFVGVGLLLCSPHRTQAPSFAPFKAIWHTELYPMRIWGAILAVFALVLIVACLTGRQNVYEAAKVCLSGFWGFCAGLFAASLINGDASPFVILNVVWFRRTLRLPRDNPWLKIALTR